jgi:hypothetical protein
VVSGFLVIIFLDRKNPLNRLAGQEHGQYHRR